MLELLLTAGLVSTAGIVALTIASRLRVNRLAAERMETLGGTEARHVGVIESTRSIFRRRGYLTWIAGLLAASVVYFALDWALVFAVSVGIIAALLARQAESLWTIRQTARIELQLGDAIDLMIGALGAGAGVMVALESAVRESPKPLRAPLEEMVARIRLGDAPQTAFAGLHQRVPLETFLLFSSSLAVQWETGGSLAPTLATVGRTIRDRVELSRRIRSNTVQSQLSTFAVLGVTYFLALVFWRSNPGQMREFLDTRVGQWMVAGSILLQALGIVWMSAVSRMKF
jgi:tight adherence protein B